MVKYLLTLLPIFGALFLGSTSANDPAPKPYCPEVKVIEKLDLEKLAGVWWVWDFAGMVAYTEPHSCHSSHFYVMPGAKSISVINDYVFISNNKENHVRYTWTIEDEESAPDGRLVAMMKINRMGLKKVSFLVIDTDYDRYLVVHMCKEGHHFLSKMKSSLTLLRNLNMKEDELKDIGSKVDAALAKSQLTREDLGLFHSESYTKGCVEPKFPKSVTNGKSVVIDSEALTAHVNGAANHAKHAVDEANALATDAANPDADRAKLVARLREHAEDVEALASDVKDISTL